MDPYILNRKPNDPYDGGRITPNKDFFVQTLDTYLRDFTPDKALAEEALEERDLSFELDHTNPREIAIYRERIKHRCIAVIEHGINLYKQNLSARAEKLYLPAIEQGSIPDNGLYRRHAEELRFEDEGRLERFFTEALRKAITFIEQNPENAALFNAIASLEPETLPELLKGLSEKDKTILRVGLMENLQNALFRITDLYEPAIKLGNIPDTSNYNQRITELGIQSKDDLREKLFYFLRNALCLTNWNEDDALRTDARAFRSCLD
ncbi:MAG: hypothetical protein HYR97_04280 [Candidatus Melainabacteria bacterium]|nr:hypothetical protein [Candidatus Melainabacteria bacterium]